MMDWLTYSVPLDSLGVTKLLLAVMEMGVTFEDSSPLRPSGRWSNLLPRV